MKDADRTRAQLIEELRELRQQNAERETAIRREKRRLARVRGSVWKMETSADVQQVLNAIRDNLQELGITFEDIGVNLIDARTDPPAIRFYTVDLEGDQYININPEYSGIAVLLRIWRQQQVAYRKDLEAEDVYGEKPYIVKVKGGRVRSIIDVPFPQGTLALNSLQAEAFSREDIEVFQEMAQILSEGFQRMEDFRTIEQRNQELEREIAEREQMERELIRVQRLRAVEELSAGFCHNVNNILTGVLGPAQLIKRFTTDPRVREEAEGIIAGALRAGDLVSRLARAVRDEPERTLHPVSINEAVQQAIHSTRPRWKDQSETNGIAIEMVAELTETPAICGVQSKLDDILIQLLFNAIDALPEGGTITLRTQTVDAEVQLTVTDTGIGMDEETRRRVFEPFFTTKMTVGSGLGLTTVHGTVTRWGGGIQVESAPGEGAAFTLRFPVWAEPVIAAEEKAGDVHPPRSGNLLIVEDDEGVCRLLSRMLGQTYQVETVLNGQEALARFAPEQYDMVLVDLGMPGMPGDRVAREMRKADPLVVTVLITGWELESDDPRKSLFDFHMVKPFGDLDEIEDIVARAIELHDQRAGKGN